MARDAVLTDRAVKLLIRQRGSARRTVDRGVEISPLKRLRASHSRPPAASPGPPNLDNLSPAAAAGSEPHWLPETPGLDAPSLPAASKLQESQQAPETPGLGPAPFDASPAPFEASPVHFDASPAPFDPPGQPGVGSPRRSPLPLPAYDFSDVPVARLSSSVTSITSIDVLVALFHALFEDQLIPQSYANFETASSGPEKLMYKLDIKVFSTFLEKVLADLRDILDINISNNELCFRLKQVLRAKHDLTEALLLVRQETHQLEMRADDSHDLDDLRRKLALNEKLHQLSRDIALPPTTPALSPLGPELDDFLHLMDPYNGVLARLQALNRKLEEML
ncbi:LAFE_0C07426g1_1 [Lachancea fermentati]|uniref:LAFE_0C07426g1_1 n=1 Tax=Lachancea fermentati TaxID=4955 RepID=A0A1G4M9Z8_LACFM|nr:LAFE_0C07426g1_1 [Lachancea fermentati]